MFEEKVSRILNSLAKSAGNPPTFQRKAKKDRPDCFLWLRGNYSRTSCLFKHDPERKGSDPEAGLQKAGTSADSTSEQPKDEPNKAKLVGNTRLR